MASHCLSSATSGCSPVSPWRIHSSSDTSTSMPGALRRSSGSRALPSALPSSWASFSSWMRSSASWQQTALLPGMPFATSRPGWPACLRHPISTCGSAGRDAARAPIRWTAPRDRMADRRLTFSALRIADLRRQSSARRGGTPWTTIVSLRTHGLWRKALASPNRGAGPTRSMPTRTLTISCNTFPFLTEGRICSLPAPHCEPADSAMPYRTSGPLSSAPLPPLRGESRRSRCSRGRRRRSGEPSDGAEGLGRSP
jgi:hypothetical protein